MSFIGSVVSVIFGLFWTIMAFSMTRGTGIIGIIFPLFGVLFIVIGVVQAVYHFKNATSKERFSSFDIVDSREEEDPLNRFASQDEAENLCDDDDTMHGDGNTRSFAFCPYCGEKLEQDYHFCPFCGRRLG